jgi:TRAP-type C4-dicarboxylate transport system permease small subunit
MCILLTWRGFAEGIITREMNILSSTLGFPMWPFYWVTAVGYGVFCLAIIVLLVRSLSEITKK